MPGVFEKQLGVPPVLKGFLSHCTGFSFSSGGSETETVERPGQFSVTTDKCNQTLLQIQMREDGGSDQARLHMQQLHSKSRPGVLLFLQSGQSLSKENLEGWPCLFITKHLEAAG